MGRYNGDFIKHMEQFQNWKDVEFGSGFLSEFLRVGMEERAAELPSMTLEYDRVEFKPQGTVYGSFKTDEVSIDGTYVFLLYKGGENVARLSFDAISGGVHIVQIQSVKGAGEALAPIKWERALIAYVCKWASEWGLEKVEIVSAKNNVWVQDDHIPYERAHMIYDVSAKRSGFRENADGNWVKFLEAA